MGCFHIDMWRHFDKYDDSDMIYQLFYEYEEYAEYRGIINCDFNFGATKYVRCVKSKIIEKKRNDGLNTRKSYIKRKKDKTANHICIKRYKTQLRHQLSSKQFRL